MDTISISIASDVLQQLKQPASSAETVSHMRATELLKSRINPAVYDIVLDRFSQLCEAVYHERCSRTISEYLQQRKNIGSLTAEISYLLIMPYLNKRHSEVRKFFCKVGEVGCLVDSLIDLRSDHRKGLVDFRANFKAYIKILVHTASIGIPLVWRYPNLIQIFYEAVVDNCRDIKR